MAETNTVAPANAFQLKGSLFTLTVLQLSDANPDTFSRQLDNLVEQAPKFFSYAPVVIDLQSMKIPNQELDIGFMQQLLRQRNMILVGIRGGTDAHHNTARSAGVAVLSVSKSDAPEIATKKASVMKEADAPTTQTKIITKPVRSGQQVYARGGDLIILSSVSQGAELLADGNIHVYGPLRGRALAGVTGNTDARIFCQSMEAELVSIAGRYIANDALQQPLADRSMQIFLEQGKLQVQPL